MFGNASTWRPESASLGEPGSLGEIFDASREQQVQVDNLLSAGSMKHEAYVRRIDAIKQATGVDLVNPYEVPEATRYSRRRRGLPDVEDDFLAQLKVLAERHPDKRDIIRPDTDPREEARASARAAEWKSGELFARTPGIAKWGAAFAGGFVGTLQDPANLASMLIGSVGEVGQGARAVIWMGMKQGAANAGVEAASQPFVQAWRKEAGLEHGLSHAALNVAFAGALGFGLDAGVRGAYRGTRNALGRGDVSENIRAQNPEDALEALARSKGPTATLRKAADGDPDALTRAVAQMPEVKADPAVRGAVKELQLEAEIGPVKVPDADDADHMLAVVQALRHATNDGEPPAGPITRLAPEKGPRLSDDSPSPAPVGRSYRLDDKPVHAQMARPRDVTADPGQFQFRGGADAVGDTGRLAGITKWDDLAAGRVLLFERADGTRVIADGHHRLALAKRLEAEGQQGLELEAHVFREADGWTAGDVRALAAKKNLQEGRADAVDAARVLRERPDILDASVGLGSEAMRQARSLARLSDPAFGQVMGGMVPPNHAALVGDLVPDKALHAPMLADLARAGPENVREARHLVAEMLSSPVHAETQLTLLGAETVLRPLAAERAKVLDKAIQVLAGDARIFGLLNREAGRIEEAGNRLAGDANARRAAEAAMTAEIIDRLARQRGPVSDLLNEAARAVAEGQPPKRAADAFAGRVRSALERDGMAGLMADPGGPAVRRLDEPGGPDAQAQVESLTASLGDAAKHKKPEALASAADGSLSLFRITDPTTYRPTARAAGEMAALREAVDGVLAKLPREVRGRVEEGFVYRRIGDGRIAELDGYFDPYEALVYVALGADDPVRVARHESVHVLRRLNLLAEDEWRLLRTEAERRGLRKDYDIDGRYKAAYGQRFKGDEAGLEAALWEETIAEMVADKLGGRQFGGTMDRVLQRIVDVLRAVRDALGLKGFRTVADVFEGIDSGAIGRRGMTEVELPGGGRISGFHLFSIKAFHGSPHDFDRFDMSKIGTGTGLALDGFGINLASERGLAAIYRDMAADRQAKSGGVYEVRINAEPADLLNLEAAFSAHSSKTQAAIRSLGPDGDTPAAKEFRDLFRDGSDPSMGTVWGHVAYWHKGGLRENQQAFRQQLAEAGVPGITTKDTDFGGNNYVIFNDRLIEIVAKDGQPVVSTQSDLARVAEMGDAKDVVEACKV